MLSTIPLEISLNVAPLPSEFKYSTFNRRTVYKYRGVMPSLQMMFLKP